jgi:hypothetical protein
VTSLGPGTKTTSKGKPLTKPNKTTPNKPRTDQLDHGTNHTDKAVPRDKSHQGLALVRLVKSTSQTGHAWAARDEQRSRVNSLKSNSRLPIRSTDSHKTLGIVGTPHGHSIAKLWSTETH